MKTKVILGGFLAIMTGMIVFAIFFQEALMAFLTQPIVIRHARFIHIAAVSLFFANAVSGMIWERRSLSFSSKEVILHTYNTVASLDAHYSSPLIILSVTGGLSLSFGMGDLWQIGWLSISFLLFIFSGILWVVSDIPTQYKIKRLISTLKPEDQLLPKELIRLLKVRWWISIAGVIPLVIAFVLMVYKPELTAVSDWFR